jgi:D-alanyl-lipoteichoic acid acyltransferase DltB (MBOAT superfamily)
MNLMVTMLLGGLWHGANIKFVIWGGLHGLGLVLNKLLHKILPHRTYTPGWIKVTGWIITFHFVCFAWIFFRADSMQTALAMIQNIAFRFSLHLFPEILLRYSAPLMVLSAGLLLHWLPTRWKEAYRGAFIHTPILAKAAIVLVCSFIIYQFKTSDLQPFIYFQF